MTDPSSLLPISDEQAKLGQKALEVLQGLGGFLREIFGTVPEDLVGYFGGDLLKVRRAENFARIAQEAREWLKAREVHTTEPPSISILLPIIVASAEESKKEARFQRQSWPLGASFYARFQTRKLKVLHIFTGLGQHRGHWQRGHSDNGKRPLGIVTEVALGLVCYGLMPRPKNHE